MNSIAPMPGSTANRPAQGRRLVHLRLVAVNVWSAFKVSFLVSIALAIVGLVLALLTWLFVSQLGLFQPINDLLSTTSSDGAENVARIFSFGRVMGLSVLAGIVTIIFGTLFGGLCAVIYNAIARIVGGLKLTFSNVR
ncbi:MAG: DUF3566 domain-containing protein [Pseudoclavibacter caeni]|jgi:hypothetical protein